MHRTPTRSSSSKVFPAKLAAITEGPARGKQIELWFQDEMRLGQKNPMTRRRAKRGTRDAAPKDQHTQSAARHCPRTNGGQRLAFGAICPAQGKGAAIVMPRCVTKAMTEDLTEISRHVSGHAHAVVSLDQAGWHQS